MVEEQPTILARRPKQKKQQQRQKVDELAEDLSHLTVEEQEQYRIQKMHEEYQKAKERIFGKEEEPSAPYPVASEGDSGIQVQGERWPPVGPARVVTPVFLRCA